VIRRLTLVSCLGLALTACSPAEPDLDENIPNAALDQGALLSAVCSGCHADGGKSLNSLEGRSASELEPTLLAYREVETGDTVMHRLARGYSAEELSAIAAYLSQERDE